MKVTIIREKRNEINEVEIREPLYADIRRALETSGLGMGDLSLAALPTLIAHLIHVCAKFDGQHMPIEEIEKMPVGFFFEVLTSLGAPSVSIEAVKASLGTTQPESTQG
jgi:hypothetical protein